MPTRNTTFLARERNHICLRVSVGCGLWIHSNVDCALFECGEPVRLSPHLSHHLLLPPPPPHLRLTSPRLRQNQSICLDALLSLLFCL